MVPLIVVDEAPPARTPFQRLGIWLLEGLENVIYVGISVALGAAAVALLVVAGRQVFGLLASPQEAATIEVLDTLLLLFIIVELLFTVRTTLAKREIVAEPFLIVGIIASIKEIVVLSVKAADNAGEGDIFRDEMIQIALLGGLVLVLGITSLLLRRKEREPEEGREPAPA